MRICLQALAALLGGRPLALVAELALREPRLLAQPVDSLEQRFDAIAASFGSFRYQQELPQNRHCTVSYATYVPHPLAD